MAGSGTVLINTKAKKYIYNDNDKRIAELFSFIKNDPLAYEKVKEVVQEYNLSSTNKIEYNNLRADYSINPTPAKLLALICHSFSNGYEITQKGKFNVPFGKRTLTNLFYRNYLNTKEFLNKNKVEIYNKDFSEIIPDNENDFIYLDPPYLGADTNYNRHNGWTIIEENKMYDYVSKLKCIWWWRRSCYNKIISKNLWRNN